MAVSIDRYIGVTRPLNYSIIMTTRRTIYLIIIVWAVSILTSVVPLFGLTDREKRPIDSLSDQDYFETCKVNKDKFYTIFSSMVSFYIPVVILLILYSRVYQEAKIQGKKLENEKRRLYELDYQIASEHIRRKQGNTVRRPSEQALDERRPMLSTGREKRSNSNATDNCKISASTSKNSNGKFSSDELTPDLTIHSNDGAQLRREYLGTRVRRRRRRKKGKHVHIGMTWHSFSNDFHCIFIFEFMNRKRKQKSKSFDKVFFFSDVIFILILATQS